MSLLDITPTPMRDPFEGGLLPETFTTRNSRYDIREHVRKVWREGNKEFLDSVTVTCVVGTLAGQSWTVEHHEIRFTRHGLFVEGGPRTMPIETVNGYPVAVWA